MVKDGVIKRSPDALIGLGIFTKELTNLFKRWRKDTAWDNESLMETLINQVRKDEKDIVILRIPTSKLDKDRLKIRSQQKLFSSYSSLEDPEITKPIKAALNAIPKEERKNWLDKAADLFVQTIGGDTTHLRKGAPVGEHKRYEQNKEAIEYVYQNDIEMDKVEKIGEVNIDEIESQPEYNPKKPLWSFFTNLLKGTPEAKGAELLNC